MLCKKLIVFATLVIIACDAAPEDKSSTETVTDVTVSIETVKNQTKSENNDDFPTEDDVLSANSADDASTDDEKSTAKRTINHHSSKFARPIVVTEQNLFAPSDEYLKKQINVQIIEPEAHNNGQFLKETLFQKQDAITTSTTEPVVSVQKTISAKFLAPIQAGLRLSNDDRCKTDERCGESSTQKTERIDIEQNTKIKKVIVQQSPQYKSILGSRFNTTPKVSNPCNQSPPCSTPKPKAPNPCDQSLPCSTPKPLYPISTVRIRPQVTTKTPVVLPLVSTPIPVKTQIVQQPIYIHTEKIVDRPVEVEKVVKQLVNVPYPVEVEKLVVKEIPVDRVVEKHIEVPSEKIVERPVIVEKQIPVDRPVPVDRIVEKYVDRPVVIEKEKFIDRIIEKPVPVDRVVEKLIDRPIEIEKVVEKEVPVDRVVEKLVDRPVAVPYLVEVNRPIHVPYLVQVQVPYPVLHVPYELKPPPLPSPPPPPPPPHKHFILKTTKYNKHGFFGLKHGPQKIKHVFIKQPNTVTDEIANQSTLLNPMGLSPPPRFQPYVENFGPQEAASINLVQAVLPNSFDHHHHHHQHQHFIGAPIQNDFTHFNYNNKLKFDEFLSKSIRWEYGFKPPLIPSVEIDEFGNPIDC